MFGRARSPSHHGKRAYVTAGDCGRVCDDTNPVRAHSSLSSSVQGKPLALLSSRWEMIYVANGAPTWSVIDASEEPVVSRSGGQRLGIAVSREGAKVYTPTALSDRMSIIDARTRKVVGSRQSRPTKPWVCVSPAAVLLFSQRMLPVDVPP